MLIAQTNLTFNLSSFKISGLETQSIMSILRSNRILKQLLTCKRNETGSAA